MASVLKLLLERAITPESVISWIQQTLHEETPVCLKEISSVQQEFIPFFLNYLRDHTIHLLQTSKSATPSPAKTPSIIRIQKTAQFRLRNDGKKRQQLFGASPSAEVDELKNLPSSVFSPNTSLDSPGQVNRGSQFQRGGSRSHYASQKGSPRCGSQHGVGDQNQTPDQQRSKQKLSLGEFFCTPEHGGHGGGSGNWRKSPHSGGKRDQTCDSSPSPVVSRRSGGRRKYNHSPLVQASVKNAEVASSPPIFSLASTNDFPPMKQQDSSLSAELGKVKLQESNNNCDTKISRVINFNCEPHDKLQILTEPRKQNSISAKKVSSTESPGMTSKPQRRRIAPTLLKADTSTPQNAAFLVPVDETKVSTSKSSTSETFGFAGKDTSVLKQTVHSSQDKNDTDERLNQEVKQSPSIVTPTKLRLEHSSSVDLVEARPGEVTHQEKLDLLICLYSKCLEGNLLPNLIVEFYFLSQLLTARGGDITDLGSLYEEDLLDVNYFTTVHNAVYFAVNILQNQKRLLHILDKGTLRLMSENQRIAAFSSTLLHFLEMAYEAAASQKLQAFPRSPIGSVSFQADTDNRRNFPSDRSFHLFKRQRDGFYELIREWEAGHLNPDWNSSDIFKTKVKALVNFRTELVNHMHFARLFLSQLLAMCKGDGCIRQQEDDENITLLSQLKRSNPEKFKRLQERFIKPLSVGGPCPVPSFPGCQEFFRDFIIAACNPVFNQHLIDTFSGKILELNSWTISGRDEDDAVTTHEDEEVCDMFFTIVMSLRLVGKFLGFVIFLPYQSLDRLPDNIEASYIAVRNKQPPQLDLCGCLRDCVRSGHLTLTMPWIVEYLSMMDTVAPRLDHYQQLLFSLLYIHRCVWKNMMEGEMCYSNVMIVTMVSWLFDNPGFPEGLFFSDIPSSVKLDIGPITKLGLQDSSLIKQTLFYSCCPYIGEIKALLVEFAVGTNSKATTIRKITPVSADIPPQKSVTERQLQLQMEENFFHNHPASMKRVVDFVADRTASNFIKKFRGNLLLDSIAKGKDKVMKQLVCQAEGSPSSKLKDRLSQVTLRVAQEVQSQVQLSVAEETNSYCSGRIPVLMSSLLPDDQSSVVVTMASGISLRMAQEKINQWMNKHITIAMFQTELQPDIEKVNKSISIQSQKSENTEPVSKSENNQSGHVTAAVHNDALPHPADVLIELKDNVKNLVLRNISLTEEKVSSLLALITATLNQRQDVLPVLRKSFSQLTLELILSIIVRQPNLYNSETVDICVQLWQGYLKDNSINHVLSGRVVLMIQDSNNPKEAWRLLDDFLTSLVKSNLLSLQGVQQNCLKIVQTRQDLATLRNIAGCICSIADCLTVTQKTEDLGGCLDWLYRVLAKHDPTTAGRILQILGLTTADRCQDKCTTESDTQQPED